MKVAAGTCVWVPLAVCAVLVLGGMSWLTRSVVAAERERSEAQARADLQEDMRLALWRMDSAGAAFTIEETQRADGPLAQDDNNSPVRMRFEIRTGGTIALAQPAELTEELREVVGRNPETTKLLAGIASNCKVEAWGAPMVDNTKDGGYDQFDGAGKASATVQARANIQEYNNRGRAVSDVLQKTQALNPQAATGPHWAEAGVARPAWIDGELFLLRRIERDSGSSVQGIWLDADKLKAMLLAEAGDLLPKASLIPALEPSDDGMVLASFPWRLVTPLAQLAPEMQGGMAVSLAVGWLAVLLAMLAGALLVRGVMRLSERRASFVSAVTHELRTPLTTFKLYTDLLENDVVRGEKRREYLHVLGREANRLTHLVENVLAFSRIERGSAKSAVRTASAAELLEPLRDRLAQHLADAGLALRMEIGGEAARVSLQVDAAAVEHILFNLIDNAAKYAAGSDPAEVSIAVKMSPRGVAIIVCDHGPGVSTAEERRIFRPFHKSARDAAESRPGVGLGLALSRRLAREHGGELAYQPDTGGGCFVLSLRRLR